MANMKPKFVVGERVLCFEPDQSKARVLYDAKILDADVIKDGKSKKETEYKIHFQGWNSAWDRWANESFVLKNTEENKKLQRKLAKRAIKKLRTHGRKRVHLPGVASVLKNIPVSEIPSDSDSSSDNEYSINDTTGEEQNESDGGLNSPAVKRRRKKLNVSSIKTNDDTPGCSVDTSIPEQQLEQSVSVATNISKKMFSLDLPPVLKRRLEEDNIMITKRKMLVNLPAKLSVVQILENYIRYFAMNIARLPSSEKNVKSVGQTDDKPPPEKNLNLCKETCEDLRILFDFTLPIVLLYYCEREQCKTVVLNGSIQDEERSNSVPESCSIYEHLPTESTVLPKDSRIRNSPEKHTPVSENMKMNPIKSTISNDINKKKSSTPKGFPKSSATHHRKTAEEQIIEETHTYIIPHQPNLDRTGLSNDAQGRRRSSRLSHHLGSPEKSGDDVMISPPLSPITSDVERSSEKHKAQSSANSAVAPISMETIIFLRAPSLHHHGTRGEKGCHLPIPLLCKEGDRYSCASPTISLRQMCQEMYVGSAGEDVRRAVHLAQAWKYRLFPPHYLPPNGANVPCSLVYGIHHFLRLFVKIPQIFSSMHFPDHKQKIIYKHLQNLLKFLAEYDREIYLASERYVHA